MLWINKKQTVILLAALLFCAATLPAQEKNTASEGFAPAVLSDESVIYTTGFEEPGSEWTFSDDWHFTKYDNHNALTFSLNRSTESAFLSSAVLKGINLDNSSYLNASVLFKYQKTGSDSTLLQLEYSTDGLRWLTLGSLSSHTEWRTESFNLDFACGQPSVSLRITVAGGVNNSSGNNCLVMIDDFRITVSSVDNTAPLIIHTPAPALQSGSGENEISALITDLSGIKSARLLYRINRAEYEEASIAAVKNGRYTFIIPPQLSGTLVEYKIEAVDNSANRNSTLVDNLKFIAGYQPSRLLTAVNEGAHNLYYGAAAEAGIRKIAIPVTSLPYNRDKLLSYLLIRSFAADDPSGSQIGIRFLEPDYSGNRLIPGNPLSSSFQYSSKTGSFSDPYGYLLIDLREQKFGLENLPDSLLFLELTAEKGKSALVYLPQSGQFGYECFFSGSSTADQWESASFTDSTGAVVYPFFQSELIFSSRDRERENRELASKLKLENVANPLNSTSSIRFELNKRSRVFLAVYDLLGREVNTLVNGQLKEGVHSIALKQSGYASGIYYYILKVDDKILKRKLVVTR